MASYVSLGDSISIDDYSGGPGRGGASLLFRNRDDDFPSWRGRDLQTRRPDMTFRLLATDGATRAARHVIADVRTATSLALTQLEPLLAPRAQVVVGTVYDPSDGTAD